MRKQYHTRHVGGDRHSWDVHRLVRLSKGLPIVTVPVTDIAETNKLWWYQEKDNVPTPQSIAEHMLLVQQADLRYPIIPCRDGRLMDGMHRVVKALIQSHQRIDAVRFVQTPEPDFINADITALPYPVEDVSPLD